MIPPKRDRARRLRYDRAVYRERNVVERALGHLEEHRRVATRHERLALSFLAMVELAFVVRYLRILESRDRP